VVIGIIAVLIGILLPVLGKARESATAVQCMSNLRQFAIADQMYVNQYRWHMPGWWQGQYGASANAYNAYQRYWAGITDFRKALAMPVIFPINVGFSDPPGFDPLVNKPTYRCFVTRKWYCANAVKAFQGVGPDPITNEYYFQLHYSYGMNVMGVDIREDADKPDVLDPRATQADVSSTLPIKCFHGFKPSQVRKPGEKIHFADAMYMVINPYGMGSTGAPYYRGWHKMKSNYDLIGESTETEQSGNGINSQRSIAWRHKKGANIVFFDGHGEWLRSDRLMDKDPTTGNFVVNKKLWNVMD
jgi:prepilin-type processing-associated H-X9-DG protein